MKMRNGKAPTVHTSLPPHTEDFYTALQQMSSTLVAV